jgi:hypothetical protein
MPDEMRIISLSISHHDLSIQRKQTVRASLILNTTVDGCPDATVPDSYLDIGVVIILDIFGSIETN